jgi:hypothetical protein
MFSEIFSIIQPVVVGALVSFVMTGLRKASTAIDGLPGIGKQLMILVIAYGLQQASAALGMGLPTDVAGLLNAPDAVGAVLTALTSMGFYAVLSAFGWQKQVA